MGPGAVLILAHLGAPTPASRQLQVPDALAGLGAALNKAALIEAQKKLLADTETVYPKDEDAAKKGDVDTGMSVFTNTDTYKDTEDISPICPAPKCPDVLFPITCNGVTKTFEPDPQNGCEPPNIKCPRTTFDVSQLPDWLKERVWYSLPSKWRWCAEWRWWKVPFCSYGRKKEQKQCDPNLNQEELKACRAKLGCADPNLNQEELKACRAKIAKQKENADQNADENDTTDLDYAIDGEVTFVSDVKRKRKENKDQNADENDTKDVPKLKTKCSDTCVANLNGCVNEIIENEKPAPTLATACDTCLSVEGIYDQFPKICVKGCTMPFKGMPASPGVDSFSF
jgi:hypothetical protein